MQVQRFDRFQVQATKTPEGFIQDSPIIGRVGILTYTNADGTVRREYRPPEEAFAEDSLATLKGKPVTVGHPGLVCADNVAAIKPIGTVLTGGIQDGDNIRADMVIYNLDTPGRELSCGYNVDMDETPGEWQGKRYDAVQRNIRYNHVAVVRSARAGPAARLNMDGNQVDNEEEKKEMAKIRLDNNCEYEVPQEVIAAFEQYRKDHADLKIKADSAEAKAGDIQKQLDATEAERDNLKSEAAKAEEKLKEKDKEHADSLNEAIKQRVSLLSVAATHGVEKSDELTDRQIKEAVIKSVRGDGMDLTAKSDEYVQAAFDLCKDDAAKREDAMSGQRKAVNNKPDSGERKDGKVETSATARQRMIDATKKAYQGGK